MSEEKNYYVQICFGRPGRMDAPVAGCVGEKIYREIERKLRLNYDDDELSCFAGELFDAQGDADKATRRGRAPLALLSALIYKLDAELACQLLYSENDDEIPQHPEIAHWLKRIDLRACEPPYHGVRAIYIANTET